MGQLLWMGGESLETGFPVASFLRFFVGLQQVYVTHHTKKGKKAPQESRLIDQLSQMS